MTFQTRILLPVLLTLALSLGAVSRAETPSSNEETAPSNPWPSRAGILGIYGDAGYYTYGMDEVNNRYLRGRDGSINGGLGYGAGLKFCLSRRFALKGGIDYLFAGTDSTRYVNGVTVTSRVDLPATMIFLGGEYSFLPLGPLDLKLQGGYLLANIFNGHERGGDGNSLDLGSVRGTGSGGQAGLGLELNLSPGFSLETDLDYNFAKISGATFTGAPADPGSVERDGTVDYSGIVAKIAFNIYFVP